MAQTLFFATKEDILPVLESLEKKEALKYVPAGVFYSPDCQGFLHAAEIEGLGTATSESSINSQTFLVCQRGVNVCARSSKLTAGNPRFFIDQLINPDTITLTPGGTWKNEILLSGRIATASDSEASKKLMKEFRAAIRKQFINISPFYVGHGAHAMLRSGKRLTDAVQSPREYDLTLK